ncbi:MAG: 50S ribosomal protein L5 [bacterium]|nr:50S ribosomal protein L5 [bacterium]
MVRLAEKYQKEIMPELKKEFALKNILAVPKITKVVVNIGLKEAAHDEGVLNKASEELATITGQKPSVRRAKQSIAGFKLGKGNPVGLTVTLRGARMYTFLDKLFNIVFPRVRDFRGTSVNSFDGKGNYSLGIAEQVVFPEVEFSKIDKVRGLEITIATNTQDDEKAKKLLELLGMPFASAQGKPYASAQGKPSANTQSKLNKE